MTPEIAIIIPAYNAAKFLAATLDSVAAQTFAHWHCTIVDDGSQDATAAITQSFVQRDTRFSLLQQKNAGHGAAKNAGFAASPPDAPFVIFMDADDLWEPSALQTLLDTLQRNPEALASHALADMIDPDGNPYHPGERAAYGRNRIGLDHNLRPIPWPPHQPTSFPVIACEDRVAPSGVILYRRSALQRSGLFDTSLPQYEELHLHLRLTAFGHFAYTDQILVRYRQHPHNWSKRNVEAARAYWVARHRAAQSPLLTDQHRLILRISGLLQQKNKTRMWRDVGTYDLKKADLKKAARCYAHMIVNYLRYWKLKLRLSEFA
jgi:glycosyltransferase involved in cell wall biosynthesis